jgi:hypothetical protein
VDEPRYRERAKALAAEFATYDTTSEIITVLTDLAVPLPRRPDGSVRDGR